MPSHRPPLFRKRWFEPTVIVTCVRWYLRFSLSSRDVKELIAERGLSVAHTSIWRWVQTYGPEVLRRLRGQVKRKSSTWHIDETFVRVAGRWMYLFRAVDSRQTVSQARFGESGQSTAGSFCTGWTAQLSGCHPRIAEGRSRAPPLPTTHATLL